MSEEKQSQKKLGPAKPGPGRPKGVPNRTTTLLKDAILQAAANAGGEGGLEGYLTLQAMENAKGFLPLLGKVLPMQILADLNVTSMTKEQRDAAVAAAHLASSAD